MTWWQILLAIIFTVPWIYFFIVEVILDPILHNKQYDKDYKNWNKQHPDLQRRKCKGCKYAVSVTFWDGLYRYPNKIPRRKQTYCKLTNRKIFRVDNRCMIATPTNEYFFEVKNKKELFPHSDTPIYFSAYGDCYHSTPHCRSIKKSRHIYTNSMYISDRYPCPKCWDKKDDYLVPKKSNKRKITNEG